MDIVTFLLYFAAGLVFSAIVLGVACRVAIWADEVADRRELTAIDRERLVIGR